MCIEVIIETIYFSKGLHRHPNNSGEWHLIPGFARAYISNLIIYVHTE